MGCVTLQATAKGCADQVGGIRTIYIAEWDEVTAVATDASGVVTAITTSPNFQEYKVRRESSNWTEPIQKDATNGTTFYQPTLNFMLKRKSAAIRTEVLALAKADLMIIIQENTGTYFLLGEEAGMEMIPSAGAQSGTAFGDANQYDMTFEGRETAPAKVVDPTIIAGIITAAT